MKHDWCKSSRKGGRWDISTFKKYRACSHFYDTENSLIHFLLGILWSKFKFIIIKINMRMMMMMMMMMTLVLNLIFYCFKLWQRALTLWFINNVGQPRKGDPDMRLGAAPVCCVSIGWLIWLAYARVMWLLCFCDSAIIGDCSAGVPCKYTVS